MPRAKKSTRKRKIIRWTTAQTKMLRQKAGKVSVPALSKALKRSPAAIRFKAHLLKVSLAQR